MLKIRKKNMFFFFSCLKDHSTRKLGVTFSPFTDRHTDTQSEEWLLRAPFHGFRICFLQPIIKDRPNDNQTSLGLNGPTPNEEAPLKAPVDPVVSTRPPLPLAVLVGLPKPGERRQNIRHTRESAHISDIDQRSHMYSSSQETWN